MVDSGSGTSEWEGPFTVMHVVSYLSLPADVAVTLVNK